MHLRSITRWFLAASTVFLAAASAPALGQADLGVTIAQAGEGATSTGAGFTLGGGETYVVTVANAGPTHVTGFTLNATIDAALDVDGVTGCEPVTAGVPFPCTWSGSLLSGGETSITIDVSYPAPDPLSPGTQTCPAGAVTLTSSVTISNPTQLDNADPPVAQPVTDPVAGNDTAASAPSPLRNWAEIEVVSLDGPPNVNEGQTVTYTAVVRNNGPCDAPNTRVTLGPAATVVYVDGTASAACTNGSGSGTGQFGVANRCELGTLASGASQTVSANYTVITFPSEIIRAAIPVDVSIASRTLAGPPVVLGADDPDGSNNSGSTSATVDLSDNEGCSTGGASTLLGLLSLVALRFGRRRSS